MRTIGQGLPGVKVGSETTHLAILKICKNSREGSPHSDSLYTIVRMTSVAVRVDRAPRVLLVDDDRELSLLMTEFLSSHGYEVTTAADGAAGLEAAFALRPDLVILDVMMPRLDGFNVVRQLRRQSRVPVLMVSARTAPDDRILGLNVGADDYLPKPFAIGELLARIRAILRRGDNQSLSPVTVGALRLDGNTRRAFAGEQELTLTATEFDLLTLLCESPGTSVSRDAIARSLYGRETTAYERAIDVHVSHLRRKLGEVDGIVIKTVRGTGYLLTHIA